jgi:hypothetical protein
MAPTAEGATNVSKFNAAGPMLGYPYQCGERCCLRSSKPNRGLASRSRSRGSTTWLSTRMAPRRNSCTSSICRPTSLTDMSVDLWKTLRNWCQQTSDDHNLPFERRLTSIATAQPAMGSAAELLRFPRPSADAEVRARALLCTAANNSTNQDSAAGRNAFLALSEQD